ncbi:hypothetical protein CERSUDRAFT_95506 [Gelatoporia subvermispora B]|uniref:C2H2-type domain-containing protein n=1 Tax=Ceriporiopsis subvermispora (strain B) TaxID=914234 RepID=M2RCL6_CERS8|nr:hypothetical protein CERSUDRAFT_95506 [Gelatoporia subvermispora B]
MAQTAVDQIFEPPIDYEQLAQAVQNEIALRFSSQRSSEESAWSSYEDTLLDCYFDLPEVEPLDPSTAFPEFYDSGDHLSPIPSSAELTPPAPLPFALVSNFHDDSGTAELPVEASTTPDLSDSTSHESRNEEPQLKPSMLQLDEGFLISLILNAFVVDSIKSSPLVSTASTLRHRCGHCEYFWLAQKYLDSVPNADQIEIHPPTFPPFFPQQLFSRGSNPADVPPCPHANPCPCNKDHYHDPDCIVRCLWKGCGKMFVGAAETLAHLRGHWPKGEAKCQWEGCPKAMGRPAFRRHLANTHVRYLTEQCQLEWCDGTTRVDMKGKRHARCAKALAFLDEGITPQKVKKWWDVEPKTKEAETGKKLKGSCEKEGVGEARAPPAKRARAHDNDDVPRQAKRARTGSATTNLRRSSRIRTQTY